MKKTIYYYETDRRHGRFNAIDDKEAIDKLMYKNPMVIYKESDTPDGTPFIIIYERSK